MVLAENPRAHTLGLFLTWQLTNTPSQEQLSKIPPAWGKGWLVHEQAQEFMEAGWHEWTFALDSKRLPPGVCLLRVSSGHLHRSTRITFLM